MNGASLQNRPYKNSSDNFGNVFFQIKYMFSRGHRKFGAPIRFTDRNASHVKDSYVECTSYQDQSFSIKVLEKHVAAQMVPKVRESSTQTQW